MYNGLERVCIAMVFAEIKEAHCSPEKIKMDRCELIGFFKDKECAERALVENANELVNRTGFQYAMIGIYNLGELQPKPLEQKFYKAETYEDEVPCIDSTTYEVHYLKEERYRFVPMKMV